MNHDGVLFISFGGPEKKEDIMPFLRIVTRGRGIPEERLLDVAHHYEEIGGRSPINEITRAQADALSRELASAGTPLPVHIGNRNWHPFLEDTLRSLAQSGAKRLIGFATAAHRSEASLERYVNAVEQARKNVGDNAPLIDYVAPWFDHPLFIEAIAARVEEALQTIPAGRRGQAAWMFTAHSIPCGMAKESMYVAELRATAEGVAKRLGQDRWCLAYTSRSGNPRDAWLEPDAGKAIQHLKENGTSDVLAIPIGFIADHVEVLYDLDIEAKQAAQEAGVGFYRAKTVGDHPLFIRMMVDVIRRRMTSTGTPEDTSSESTRYQDGRVASKVGQSAQVCFCDPTASEPPCQSAKPSHPTGRPAASR